MFPPSLYKYVREDLKKDIILVLNKIDLAPAPLVAAWRAYFKEKYPDLHIVMFTTLPGYNLVGKQVDKGGTKIFDKLLYNVFTIISIFRFASKKAKRQNTNGS